MPDTLNNYEIGWKSTSLNGRLLWNGAAYLMNWKQLQTIIYDVNICAPSSFYVNVGDARIYGVESNVDYKLSENWSLQAAGSYTDSHLISSPYPTFEANVGERLPYVPYFSWSANLRYEHPLGKNLRGYAQFDIAHKGDMWNDLHVAGSNGFPRILQPSYTIMNLRFGLNPEGATGSPSSISPTSLTRTRLSTATPATSICARRQMSHACSACASITASVRKPIRNSAPSSAFPMR